MYHALLAVVVAFAACVAFVDFRTGMIPNALHGFAVFGALVVWVMGFSMGTAAVDTPIMAVRYALTGAIACAIPALLLYTSRTVGAGDAKALCSVGFVAGAELGLQITVASLVAAAVYGLAVAAASGALAQVLKGSSAVARNWVSSPSGKHETSRTMLRFGPPLFAATVAVSAVQW
jgi:Flp pilus assembly protein protease CpaA